MDNPTKIIFIWGNIISTIIYCISLFYWLYIIENNSNNLEGKIEDAKAFHLAIGSFIFYALFLLDRVGTYILDLF